jgi:hypothetical protein
VGRWRYPSGDEAGNRSDDDGPYNLHNSILVGGYLVRRPSR